MKGAELSVDYSGAHGGQMALAFAAGCVACFAFCVAVGKFMWDRLTKANTDVVASKDDTIAELKHTIEKNEERCADTVNALRRRVDHLEMTLWTHASGPLRQDLQKAISEQRVEGSHEAG